MPCTRNTFVAGNHRVLQKKTKNSKLIEIQSTLRTPHDKIQLVFFFLKKRLRYRCLPFFTRDFTSSLNIHPVEMFLVFVINLPLVGVSGM